MSNSRVAIARRETSLRIAAAEIRPGDASEGTLEDRGRRECRMQAAPVSLACKRKVHFAHASNNRAAKSTGIPCAMVYGLYVVSLVYRAC